MISGAIENISLEADHSVALFVWARQTTEADKKPVDEFIIGTRTDVVFERTDRVIDGTFGCGCKVVVPEFNDLLALRWGGLKLEARAGHESLVLQFWSGIEHKIDELLLFHFLRAKLESRAPRFQAAIRNHLANSNIDQNLSNETPNSPIEFLPVQRGTISFDFEVCVGKGGFLFLLGGTNKVTDQYFTPASDSAVDAWTKLICNRNLTLSAKGIKFIQMIVPEKQSVIESYFPFPIQTPSRLYEKLNDRFGKELYYLDCFKILRDVFITADLYPFRKVDSHLSFFGAEALIYKLMRMASIDGLLSTSSLRLERQSGDLGEKFFWKGKIQEDVLVPQSDWDFALEIPEIVISQRPSSENSGTVLEWRAARPRSPKTVLIFGNSMFERGITCFNLSWWASRIFARTRFVWSATVVEEHIEAVAPDIVICQTVERFLSVIPEQ